MLFHLCFSVIQVSQVAWEKLGRLSHTLTLSPCESQLEGSPQVLCTHYSLCSAPPGLCFGPIH